MTKRPPIHGHDVLRLLGTFPEGCASHTLQAAIDQKFGPDPVFVNCKGREFDLDALLEFFVEKGKIKVVGEQIELTGAPPCEGE